MGRDGTIEDLDM